MTIKKTITTPAKSNLINHTALEYSGRWHPWKVRHTILVSSSCQFQMRYHPFDLQQCKFSLSFQVVSGEDKRGNCCDYGDIKTG